MTVMISVYALNDRHRVKRLYVEPESCLDAAQAFYDALGHALIRIAVIDQEPDPRSRDKWARWHWGAPESVARAAVGLPPMSTNDLVRSLRLDGYVSPSG